MAYVADYNPKNNIPSWGAVLIDSGFADGEYVNVELVEDEQTATVGADGSVTVTNKASRLVTITLTLMQTAPANAAISAVLEAARVAGLARAEAPFLMTDKGGTTVFACSKAWVQKRPPIVNAKEAGNRVWIFQGIADAYFVGGN